MPLRAIPKGLCLPILQGPARGLRWRVGAGDHGCWLGSYEFEAQLACQRILRAGDAACDVGANAGFFSLVMSRLVGPLGPVTAFEPVASNVVELRQTLARNRAANVNVINAAVADHTGTSRFNRGSNGFEGRLDGSGDHTVETMALDDVYREGVSPPRLIKIDVEGAAAGVVRGAKGLLMRRTPVLLLELHDAGELAAVERELDALGYQLTDLRGAPIEPTVDWSQFVRALACWSGSPTTSAVRA